jgi:hypothetical protein
MTSHRNGLINLRKVENAGVITMGNGTQEEVKEVADIIGKICNGDIEVTVRIKDVTILETVDSIFLASVKCLKVTGSKDSITIKKDDTKDNEKRDTVRNKNCKNQ